MKMGLGIMTTAFVYINYCFIKYLIKDGCDKVKWEVVSAWWFLMVFGLTMAWMGK